MCTCTIEVNVIFVFSEFPGNLVSELALEVMFVHRKENSKSLK